MSSISLSDSLRGRVALVTGGSGGIGSSIVTRLAETGAVVAIGYGKNAVEAQALIEKVRARGGRAVAIGADLRLRTRPLN